LDNTKDEFPAKEKRKSTSLELLLLRACAVICARLLVVVIRPVAENFPPHQLRAETSVGVGFGTLLLQSPSPSNQTTRK
jgi:hypothetical protein